VEDVVGILASVAVAVASGDGVADTV
jgi:hypothetical protein